MCDRVVVFVDEDTGDVIKQVKWGIEPTVGSTYCFVDDYEDLGRVTNLPTEGPYVQTQPTIYIGDDSDVMCQVYVKRQKSEQGGHEKAGPTEGV